MSGRTWCPDGTGGWELAVRRVHGSGFDEVLARQDDAGDTAWYYTDRQGSVRVVFDNSGDTLANIDYDAFGGILSGVPVDRYAYTGREWDDALGLQYSRARMYDPSIGRWISEDTIGFDALDPNLQRYVGNGPTNGVDPSGQIIFVIPVAYVVIGGAIGVGAGTAGLYYSQKRYEKSEKYMAIPVDQWNDNLQQEYDSYIETTDLIFATSDIVRNTSGAAAFGPFLGRGAVFVAQQGTIANAGITTVGVGMAGLLVEETVTLYDEWGNLSPIERFHRTGNLYGPTFAGLGTAWPAGRLSSRDYAAGGKFFDRNFLHQDLFRFDPRFFGRHSWLGETCPPGGALGRGPNGRPMFADDWEALFAQRYGPGNVQRVPQFRTVGDILENPGVLTGRTPPEVAARIGSPPGWRVETLGQGAHAGQGWVLREYGPNGLPTGRMLRWHPGGGHHGPNPYWRAIDHNGNVGGIIPGG